MFITLFYAYLITNITQGKLLINLCFYTLIIIIFPLSLKESLDLLPKMGLSILWIGVILASIFSLENLLQKDYEDGNLELIYLTPVPLEIIIFFKTIIHWITYGFPLILMMPLLSFFINIELNNIIYIHFLINSSILSFLGIICASITLGIKSRAFLLSIITFPFYIPSIILNGYLEQSYIIIGLWFIIGSLSPIISTIALKFNFE